MAEQYRKLDVLAVRAVGTAALRDASNRDEFLARASAIIGHPVEVISGLEEARLIHLGVQSAWPHPKQRVLMMDIGGGSAELILSEGGQLVEAFSKPLGAVRLTEMFLKSDPPNPRELARMQKYIQERIAGPVARFGTARARPHDRDLGHGGGGGVRGESRAPFPARSRGPAAGHGSAIAAVISRRVLAGFRRHAPRSPGSDPSARRSSWPASRCSTRWCRSCG